MSSSVYAPERLDPSAPGRVATECIEAGSEAILLDAGALPPEFFDLSTRTIGELVHRLSVYGLRMAAVVGSIEDRSGPFQDFVREANARNPLLRFTATRKEAEDWLASGSR